MVCCLQPDPVFGCDDVASFDGDEYKCKKLPKKKCCDCSKFAGCDHLKGKRARKYRCNKRIRRLANPKWMTEKHCGQGMAMPNKRIEIIRLEEEQTPVRIRMLAYPKVRKLVSNRNDYKRIVDKQWYGQIETFIEKSMKTMYSRLANVHLPDQCRRKKWTREDWQHHCEWLQKRALPKVAKPSPRINRKRVPLDTLLPSLLELSKPKKAIQKFRYRCGFQSAVKHAAMLYQPTERIKILSLPKKLNKDEEEPENPFAVNPNALKYQPTDRLNALAAPKILNIAKEDAAEITEFGVLKRALKATVSQRILDLSKPREKGGDDEDEEEKPLVNPKALKAKPTPRIIELAQPRQPLQKVKN